jgi:hypothetical protein
MEEQAATTSEMSTNLRALVGRFKLETGKQSRTHSQDSRSTRSGNGARRVEVGEELAVG